MSNWYAAAAEFLGGFPRNYLAFDLEFRSVPHLGLASLPVQIGLAFVVDGRLAHCGDILVNWALGPRACDRHAYESAFGKAKKSEWYATRQRVVEHGVEPLEALGRLRTLLEGVVRDGFSLVAHGGYGSEWPALDACYRQLFGDPLSALVPTDVLVDTGLLVAAKRMRQQPPERDACPRSRWWQRIQAEASRRGTHWSLHRVCDASYGLFARCGLERRFAHSAQGDAILCHHLLEAMRERASGVATPTPAPRSRRCGETKRVGAGGPCRSLHYKPAVQFA